jgi:hypothetical protein
VRGEALVVEETDAGEGTALLREREREVVEQPPRRCDDPGRREGIGRRRGGELLQQPLLERARIGGEEEARRRGRRRGARTHRGRQRCSTMMKPPWQ